MFALIPILDWSPIFTLLSRSTLRWRILRGRCLPPMSSSTSLSSPLWSEGIAVDEKNMKNPRCINRKNPLGREAEIYSEEHTSSIFRQSSNPASGFSRLGSELFGQRRTGLALPWTTYRVGWLSEYATGMLLRIDLWLVRSFACSSDEAIVRQSARATI